MDTSPRQIGPLLPAHVTQSTWEGRRLYDRLGKNHGFIQYSYTDAAK